MKQEELINEQIWINKGSLYLKKMNNMHTIPIAIIARTQMHVRKTILYV